MNLRNQAISGVKWTTSASLVSNIIGIVQLMILARILSPADFGLMALVMVAIGFSELFIDMGISNAIIYKQDIDSQQLSTLFWLNILVGIFFFILLVLISKAIAAFYKSPELSPLLNLVASTFLIKPWGQQFMVLLQKNMQFAAISKTEIISRIFSFIIVLALAYNKYGVYSLAYGTIAYALFCTIGYIFNGRKVQKPLLYFKLKGVSDFIHFGLFQMGEKALNYFSAQFDSILIGKLLGVETLGVYNVAKNLAMKPFALFNPIITKVTYPMMSKVNNDISLLKTFYLKTVKYLAYVNIPIYSLFILLASPIITVLFGVKWAAAIPLLQILSLSFITASIVNPQGTLLLAQGKAKTTFLWNLFVFLVYPVSIYLGSFWGILGITSSMLILKILLLFISLEFIVNRNCKATISDTISALYKPFLISTLSSIFPLLLLFLLYVSPLIILGVNTLLFSLIFLSLVYFLDYTSFKQIAAMLPRKS